MKNKFVIFLVLIIVICIIILLFKSQKTPKQNYFKEENNNSSLVKNEENDNGSLIKLDIKENKKIQGGELLYINDYKLLIKDELVKKGYSTSVDNNILTINANDNSYKCIMIQLSDLYIMPTETEKDAFLESEEYKNWDKECDNYTGEEFDLHLEKLDDIQCEYFKNLGYTEQNSIDYVLTEEERLQKIEQYLLDTEKISSGVNGMFPGNMYYIYYSWGKVRLYTIPKEYESKTFGKDISDFSASIYFIEYGDTKTMNYIDLWTV